MFLVLILHVSHVVPTCRSSQLYKPGVIEFAVPRGGARAATVHGFRI